MQHQPWKWQEREAGAERRGVGGGGQRVGEVALGHQGGDEDEEVKQGGRWPFEEIEKEVERLFQVNVGDETNDLYNKRFMFCDEQTMEVYNIAHCILQIAPEESQQQPCSYQETFIKSEGKEVEEEILRM